MRFSSVLVLWLVSATLAAEQDTQKAHVRFFNDSAKAANFYVDSQLACSVPANPEENLAYCDARVSIGKHELSVRGPKVSLQSCEVLDVINEAEANLSKGERFHCWLVISGN